MPFGGTIPQVEMLPVGTVLQVVNTQTGAVNTGTTVIPNDDTIPQITEGTEFMTLAITPKYTTSKLLIEVSAQLSPSTAAQVICALFQDATANALAVAQAYSAGGGEVRHIRYSYYMTAGTTSSTTFRVRAGLQTAGTITFNGASGARLMGGAYASSITITEIAA